MDDQVNAFKGCRRYRQKHAVGVRDDAHEKIFFAL
jgi:hypothetical protein